MSVRKLSKELQELAIKELNEDPERIPEDIAYIKEWLSKQPHLNTPTDDQFILSFLRGCKFSLERTKEKFDMHFTLKTMIPELYQNRDPFNPITSKILSLGIMLPLKTSYPGGPLYILGRNSIAEKLKIDQVELMKTNTMIQDIMLLEDDTPPIAGTIMLQDMADTSFSFFLSFSPSLMKKATTIFQNGYPVRMKGMKVFNITTLFEKIYALIKPLLNKKNLERMRAYANVEELCKDVPIEILPEEYGGKGGKIEDIAAYWKAKVESYSDYFKKEEKYRNDEKKRPGKPKTSEAIFGVEGSFRQLSID